MDLGREYVLPDGEKIKVGPERFMAAEILFNPAVDGLEVDGCGEMVFKSINVVVALFRTVR